MSYPDRLLPKLHYQFIDFDMFNSRSYYLVRHTDTQQLTDDEGRLKPDLVTFQTDHLRDYSTNLLGEFEPNDVNWEWIKGTTCTALWQPQQSVTNPIEGVDVNLVQGRGRFYLSIAEINTTSFKVEDSANDLETATCAVLHTPTCGNFWHCSLRWLVGPNREDVLHWGTDKKAAKRRRQILTAARTFVANNALIQEPNYQSVPPVAYGASEKANHPFGAKDSSSAASLNPAINADASGPASPVSLIDDQSSITSSSDIADSAASKWEIIWASIRTQWLRFVKRFGQ